MEMLLLLLVPLALGSLFIGGGDDDNDAAEPAEDQAPEAIINHVTGTEDDEILRGSAAPDLIDGEEGDDMLFGYGNSDTLIGGAGSDFVDGGNGDDVLHGDDDGDAIAGGNGNDWISGDAGGDFLTGGAGDDTLRGGSGDDVLVGSKGADQLYGGLGGDVLDGVSPAEGQIFADAFSDDIREEIFSGARQRYGEDATNADINRFARDLASDAGEDAPDALYGGGGADWLIGNDGDSLTGGGDQDSFLVDWQAGNAAVSITDFDPMAEDISIEVEANGGAVPQFGIRDAADGSGVEVVVDGEVVAAMAELSVAALNTQNIVMQLVDGESRSFHSAVVLPRLAA
jgi:Ca2+-binding RTX toxin-like protein